MSLFLKKHLMQGRNALGDDGAQMLASGARCSIRLREL